MLASAVAALAVAGTVSVWPSGASSPATGPVVRPLAQSSFTVSIGSAVPHSCAAKVQGARPGVSTKGWRSPVNGFATVRLTGDEANDWDAALFDRRSGRRLDASSAPGANEVLQTAVRQGQALDIQVCRLRGSAGREPLTVSPVIAPLRPKAAAAPRQSLVSIRIAHRSDVARLESLGLNLDEAPTHGHATAVLGSGQAASLAAAGYRYRTLIPDMARAERGYRAQERASAHAAAAHGSALPSGRTTYRHYPDIQADLKRIVKGHPKLARSIVLPRKSFQGRDIQGIEVTAGAGSPHDGKPVFFLMGAHHAREWPSAEIPVEFGMYLTRQYGHNARVTHLLRHVRVVIVPVINPDGYITSREAFDPADQSGDPAMAPSLAESVAPPFGGTEAYRRKNCDGASPSPNTPCSAQQGVDPNRNYGEHWGGPGAGTDPGDQDYRGTDQWSEPETQAVHAFSQNHDITTLVTMHNFASLVLRPPGVHNDGLAPDEPALKRLGDRMAADTGYTSEYSFQLYDTSGTTEDWNYAAAGTYGYTIEMGPSADRGGNFHVAYQRAVINQWTGSESEKGKGKGLRDALLAAGEEATDRHQFSTLVGSAPRYSVLRLRKDFRTYSSEICTVEDTDVPCTAQGATLPRRSQADHLEYTAVLRRPGGHFRWIVSPSTRPFVLKAHHQEKWNLTCRAPGSSKVEKRQITVDRGQTLVLDLKCGRP